MATLARVEITSQEYFVKLVSFQNFYCLPLNSFTTYSYISDLRGCAGEHCKNGATCFSRDPPEFYSCDCPNNWHGQNCDSTTFDGFQYLIMDDLKAWEEARTECMNRGYVLTSITTREELDFLTQFIG